MSEMSQSTPKRPEKRKKPLFVRSGGIQTKRLGGKWRKPKGLDSKMRQTILGKPKCPKVGYGSSRKARGLHPSGYLEVLVSTPADLESMDSSSQAARISSGVGLLKRERILSRADELKLKVVNR
jgi:large subunit ribosomal protein L32e